LIAPTRRHDAAVPTSFRSATTHDLWRDVVKIRQEWLGHGLSTQPADRHTAERNLTAIYARISRSKPRFVWVSSPYEAVPLVAGWPTLDQLYELIRYPSPRGKPPLASDLAMVVSGLRGRLSAVVAQTDPELSPHRKAKRNKPWPELPALDALAAGVPLGVVLHQGTHGSLHRSLAHGFRNPIRNSLFRSGSAPVCWYGQQDAPWIAYFDVLHRLGLAGYGLDDLTHLGEWAAVARSSGWWWPGEEVCVVVDRPEDIQVEPFSPVLHDEVRLRREGLRYRDGWRPLLF
jgi:hypothetical protein